MTGEPIDESVLALGATDLADLLTVVERWAGVMPTDEQPTDEELTDPAGAVRRDVEESPVARRPSSGADIDLGRTSREEGSRAAPPDAERTPRDASDARNGTVGPAGSDRPASTRRAADAVVPPDPGPATDAAPASAGPASRIAASAAVHWTGQLPSTRPPRQREERSPASHRETLAGAPRAARPATRAGAPREPATTAPPDGESVPGDAGRGNDRMPTLSAPQVAPSAPVTLAFPSPAVAACAGDAGNSAPAGRRAGSGAAPSTRLQAAAAIAPAATDRAASLPQRGPDTSIDDLIGRDRLAEAMADAIEAALLDAGVDLS